MSGRGSSCNRGVGRWGAQRRRSWRRLGCERVKLQLFVCVSRVHAIESERVQGHVQPQRAVASLHEGYKSRMRFAHARQTELPQLRRQLGDKRLNDLRAECTRVSCMLSERTARCKPHCRTGTSGGTSSTKCVATSAMRRATHDGQKPRALQENATTISSPHPSQRRRTHPCSRRAIPAVTRGSPPRSV